MRRKGQFFKSRRKGDEGTRDKVRLDGIYDDAKQEKLVRKATHIIADAFVQTGKTVHGFFWKRK